MSNELNCVYKYTLYFKNVLQPGKSTIKIVYGEPLYLLISTWSGIRHTIPQADSNAKHSS